MNKSVKVNKTKNINEYIIFKSTSAFFSVNHFELLTFCVASPPILIAFSVALLAIFDAEEENIDQPYNKIE